MRVVITVCMITSKRVDRATDPSSAAVEEVGYHTVVDDEGGHVRDAHKSSRERLVD